MNCCEMLTVDCGWSKKNDCWSFIPGSLPKRLKNAVTFLILPRLIGNQVKKLNS